jgi:asparagine synthase (glutamine-hydrolysing)
MPIENGAALVQRFNGMFAFALWDGDRQELFCARDRLGIKPFCYLLTGGRIYFASEQKAILAGMSRSPAPNMRAIADYLSFSYSPSSDTMLEGVQRLRPGHWMTVSKRGAEMACYWDPIFDPAPPRAEAEWAEELRALLQDAIRLQVRSDVPVGAHLSGGIDSSTVCCLAAQRLPRLHVFTARFAEGGIYDESQFARLVAGRITCDHHEVVPGSTNLVELLPKITYHLDEPVEAASVFGKYHVADIVSRSVKVVLGGQGGDELSAAMTGT